MVSKLVSKDVSYPSRNLFARLVTHEDLSPMRLTPDVSPKRSIGWYASLKNGGPCFWESRNELHAFYHAEVSPTVSSYRAQPHTLELLIEGKVRRYTPDRQDHLSNGGVRIVEVKDGYKPNRDPSYHTKLSVAANVYAALGWEFVVLDRAEIEAEPSFHAVSYIQSFRRTIVTPQDEDRVIDLLAKNGGGAALAIVRGLWTSPMLGLAKLCALMVKRTIAIDYAIGLTDASSITNVGI